MATKKTATKKTATKKTATKKTATKKTATKKTAAKKTAAKKTAAKKTATKKAATKKTAAKKTATKKPATKKTATKKPATKKTATKKTATTKTATKKTTTKKAVAKKAAAKTSTTTAPLAHRLGVMSGPFHIDNPPHGFELLVPPGVEIGIDLPEKLGAQDAALAFVQDRSQVEYLASRLKKALPKIATDVALWVAYPTSGKRTDINATMGWDTLTALKLLKVGEVAVDKAWTAIRLQHTAKAAR